MRPPRLAEIGYHRARATEIVGGGVNARCHHYSQARAARRVRAIRGIFKCNAVRSGQSELAQRGIEYFRVGFFRADLVSGNDGIEQRRAVRRECVP